MTDVNTDAGNKTDVSTGADPSQKYIRTYAGDMAIMQQGGIPDLEPLITDKEPLPSPKLQSATLSPAPTSLAPAASKVEVAPVRDEARREATLARLRARAETESAQPILRPDAKPEPLPPEPAAVLHTYEADFTDHVSEQHASQASIVAAEQDAGTHTEESQESNVKKILFVVSGVLFVLIGGGVAYYEYTLYSASQAPVIIAQVTAAPIFYNEEEKTSDVGQDLYRAVERSVTHALPSGYVRLLSSTNATTTRLSLFVVMQPPAPQILLRNIEGAGSMVGVINSGDAQSPFFILSVLSYNDTFAGMLQWEPTITKDLAALFPLYPEPIPPPAPVATTTPPVATSTSKSKTTKKVVLATSTPPTVATSTPVRKFVPAFYDEIIANHDARIYRDAQGRSVVMYGYWNQNTLVIARNPEAFTEILMRLANARAK